MQVGEGVTGPGTDGEDIKLNWIELNVRYDDPWDTSCSMVPCKATIGGEVVIQDVLLQGFAHCGWRDGASDADPKDPRLGTYRANVSQEGDAELEIVADPDAAGQIKRLEGEIRAELKALLASLATAVDKWSIPWNAAGPMEKVQLLYAARQEGLTAGLEAWSDEQVEMLEAIGGFAEGAWSALVAGAKDLGEWYETLPWYERAFPQAAVLRLVGEALWDFGKEAFEDGNKLWERRDDIVELFLAFQKNAVDAIQKAWETVEDLGGEVGEIMRLLHEKGDDWIQGLIEVCRETTIFTEIFQAVADAFKLVPPTLWVEAFSTAQGYIIPEIIIAVILALVAALTAGAGSATLAARISMYVARAKNLIHKAGSFGTKVLGPLWRGLTAVFNRVQQLVGWLFRAIKETWKGGVNKVNKVRRRIKRVGLRGDAVDHMKKRDLSVPRKRGIGGAHDKDAFEKALADEGGAVVNRKPHPSLNGVEKVEYRLAKLDKYGKPTSDLQSKTFTKTIYDPKKISDDKMIKWGQEAANNAPRSNTGALGREWVGTTKDGIVIRGYYDEAADVVTSFYPNI